MNKKAVYLLVFFIFFVIVSCRETKQQSGEISAMDQTIKDFDVMETKDGKPNWILNAGFAQILESENKVLLESPEIKFYKEGEYVSTLVAEKGRINTENYDIWGEGECVLNTVKGEKMETSNLHYLSEDKKIVTEEEVKLIKPDETIYGKGMEATPDLEYILIKNQRVEMNENM
ncbi:MAG: LPS export ABC transporter periplasmic protein LptC [Endomicrobiales bacterium]|nr:LPS export ABC transporter periplasmic protein LptC [Endomicrobiales bacterium]